MLKFSAVLVDDTTKWKRLLDTVAGANGAVLDVGIFPGARPPPEATDNPAQAPTIAEYAFHNEFGAPAANIPARPFFRNALDQGQDRWMLLAQRIFADAADGRGNLQRGLWDVGREMANAIRRSITALRDPPNAASTIARKGSSNPLVDTGAMRNAVHWELHMPGGPAKRGVG